MNPTNGGPTGQTTTQASPTGEAFSSSLRDILAGMAMGSTPQESMSMAGRVMAVHGGQREQQQRVLAHQNQTLKFLTGKGVDPSTASYLASDPEAMRAWFAEAQKGQKPEWQTHDLADGTYMIDMKHPERRQKISGLKPTTPVVQEDPATGSKVQWDASKSTWVPMHIEGAPAAQPSTIPAPPPGVDPKIWREEQSKRATEEGMPAAPETTSKLRNEVQGLPSYKNIAQAAPIYKSMMEAAGRDTRAADVNMIYGMAKIMDPTSVVREGEMTIAQAIATLPQRLQAEVTSQIKESGRLSPEVRADIMQEAHGRMNAYKSMFDQDADMYRGIAKRGRMNDADVLPSFGTFDEYKPPAPAAHVASNGGPVRVQTPDEARKLPKGTKILLPDGSEGIVP